MRLRPSSPPAPEADHVLFPVNDLEGQVGPDLDHDHVDGVRADVDGGDAHARAGLTERHGLVRYTAVIYCAAGRVGNLASGRILP